MYLTQPSRLHLGLARSCREKLFRNMCFVRSRVPRLRSPFGGSPALQFWRSQDEEGEKRRVERWIRLAERTSSQGLQWRAPSILAFQLLRMNQRLQGSRGKTPTRFLFVYTAAVRSRQALGIIHSVLDANLMIHIMLRVSPARPLSLSTTSMSVGRPPKFCPVLLVIPENRFQIPNHGIQPRGINTSTS